MKSKESKIDFSEFKARVDRVIIQGLQRTHDDYLQRAVRDLFKAETFQDVIVETNNVKDNLNELNVFKNLKVLVDVSKGENASKNGYEVTFYGNELPRVHGSIGTELGQNDGAATVELSSPNVLGRGEKVSLNYSYNYSKATELNLRVTKPFLHTKAGDYKPETSITAFKHTMLSPWSKYRTENLGLLFDLSFLMPYGVTNSFQFEIGVREMLAIDKLTPFFVREHCGPRLCPVFRHIASYDARDSSVFPTSGIYLKATNEQMGSALNRMGIFKSDAHGEINYPLALGISIQICARIGMLFHGKKEFVPMNSLFYPGGPQTLRGFNLAGAGPQKEGIARGCSTYWASGVHLWGPLPFHTYFGGISNLFRTHLFYNCGSSDLSSRYTRSTIGMGLALKLGQSARIEFNYCQPLFKMPDDHAKKGFQFGIGYDFI